MDKKLILDIQLIIKDLIQNGEVSQDELIDLEKEILYLIQFMIFF